MVKKIAGYFMAAIIIHVLSGFLLAAETDYPACSKFGVQRFSEKESGPSFFP